MFSMKLTRKGRENLYKIESLDKVFPKHIHNALYEIGQDHVKHLRRSMEEKKTGRIYNIKGWVHQASSPTETPAILSKDLFRSVNYKVRGHYEMEFGDSSQPDKDPYGFFLEHGTKTQSGKWRIKPRPHISRTVKERQKDTYNTLVAYAKNGFTLS